MNSNSSDKDMQGRLSAPIPNLNPDDPLVRHGFLFNSVQSGFICTVLLTVDIKELSTTSC